MIKPAEKDLKFSVICWNCVENNKDKPGNSNVEHNYTVFPWGVRIKFHCWFCGEEEIKDAIRGINSENKSRNEFMKRMGYKKNVKN